MVLQAPDEPSFLSFSPDNDIPPIDSIYISSPHRKINNETGESTLQGVFVCRRVTVAFLKEMRPFFSL